MKRIKLGLLMGALLMSSMTMASDMKETLLSNSNSVLSTLESSHRVSNVEPLKDYDYDKNVPPSFDVLTSKVGKKDELQVFIPKQSMLYISYFLIDHPDAKQYREKYYGGIGNGEKSVKRKSSPSTGLVDPANVKKMEFYNNGMLVDLNVKDSPYTEFAVGDLNSDFDVKYTFGHGYILKAELTTSTKSEADDSKLNYVINEYKTALKNKGYSYESVWGFIQADPLYEKDETIVGIEVYRTSIAERIILDYKYDNAVMVIYDKDTFNNYDNIADDIKKKDYDIEFTKLGRILNN